MAWIKLFVCASLLASGCADVVPSKPSDGSVTSSEPVSREKRNYELLPETRLERRISNMPPLGRVHPAFLPSVTFYRKTKQQVPPPYAVAMDPLAQYSQRDPLYEASALSALPQPPNELPRPDDQATENNHLSEHFYGPPQATQFIERPVYIKEPEPIIEIIIKEANATAAPLRHDVVLPPKKKRKEEVQVFYVKYKKNPHGTGKDSVVYDRPVPALSPIQDERVEEVDEESIEHEGYIVPTLAPPPTTTIRAIIKPDSETYHADTGIHVTFGGEQHNPRAENYSHDDDIVESAPQPAVQHPENRCFPNHVSNCNSPSTALTHEYTPERRAPQPYRPFNFHQPPRPPPFQQVPQLLFNGNTPALSPQFSPTPNFNGPLSPTNRFSPLGNFVSQRTNFNSFNGPPPSTPFKQGPPQSSKPYQFDRPNGQFQSPRQPVIFNLPIQAVGNQPPPPAPAFGQKPTFASNFGPLRDTFKFGPPTLPNQAPLLAAGSPQTSFHQNQPPSVFHQTGNSFSIQANFAEPSQGFPQVASQSGTNFHTPWSSNYHTITPGRLLAEQQKQLLHQNQVGVGQGLSGSFNTIQAPPLALQLTQFTQNPFQSQAQVPIQHHQPHRQFQSHDPNQNQAQLQPQLNPGSQPLNNLIPPGGQLIQSLPKYEQHLTFSTNGDASLNSGSNYTSSQQQFPIEFSNTNYLGNSASPSNLLPPSFNIQPHHGSQGPSAYVTSPRPTMRYQLPPTYRAPQPAATFTTPKPSTTTTMTTTTTPKPSESTTINLKDLNIELPDEVPDELREQLLSSGILKNAQISVLDYDKVGDIPISALPPDQLANFYNAGGGQQIAAGSEVQPTIVKPDGSEVPKQTVEMKVVRYDPHTEQGQEVRQSYVKQGATQIDSVVLDDQTYNRYLPLRISGAAFPIPDAPELSGKRINSVVVLTPVDYNFYKQRIARAANNSTADDVQFIKNELLKQLLDSPTRENYEKFLGAESNVKANQQSVILLVVGSEPRRREIFMYDAATRSVSKLDGELSAAFVEAAETNDDFPGEQGDDTNAPQASNLVETKVPVPPGLDLEQRIDMDLQMDATNIYETRVRIIDSMRDDLEAEGSEQLKQFTDVSGDLMPAASDERVQINSGCSKTDYQMPS